MRAATTATANIYRGFMTRRKLDRAFYLRDTLTVARELIGCRIVHLTKKGRLEVIITETEAYCGITDKACHTYQNRRTNRTETMYKPGGFAYVYLIYGMYNCLNAVTERDNPCAVLIRGGVPAGNIDALSAMRYGRAYSQLSAYQKKHLADGPGKLCLALGIDRTLDGADLTGDTLFIEQGDKPNGIKCGKRINIDYAEEAREYPWRFYVEVNAE